jgi:hypothetical protein
MTTDFLEAVFEEAQRQLFHGRFAQMRSGDFHVQGQLIYFRRKSSSEVEVKVDGRFEDVWKLEA